MKNRRVGLTEVPGVTVSLRFDGGPDEIVWPNGKVTPLHCWPLGSEEEARDYRRSPIHFNTTQVQAARS